MTLGTDFCYSVFRKEWTYGLGAWRMPYAASERPVSGASIVTARARLSIAKASRDRLHSIMRLAMGELTRWRYSPSMVPTEV